MNCKKFRFFEFYNHDAKHVKVNKSRKLIAIFLPLWVQVEFKIDSECDTLVIKIKHINEIQEKRQNKPKTK